MATPITPGNYAQNSLRAAIASNGNDWDRNSIKRNALQKELSLLDQTIAEYEQKHRELSQALAILTTIMPSVTQGTREEDPGDNADAYDQALKPSRIAEPYTVHITQDRNEPPKAITDLVPQEQNKP